MDKWQNIRKIRFSSAKDYNASDFVFLVHSIDLPNSILRNFHLNSLLCNYGNDYNSSQEIDLFLNPERIAEKELVSCSLVAKKGNSEALETYKPLGFIIKCPIENVIMASCHDLGTLYTHPIEVRQKYMDEVIPPFEDIVLFNDNDSSSFYDRLAKEWQDYKDKKKFMEDENFEVASEWNEVLVEGTTVHGKVKIDGIFVNLGHFSMNDDRFAQAVIEEARELEHRLGLPLVYLPKRKYTIEDRSIEIIYNTFLGEKANIKEISFSKNGKKYRLYVGYSDTPILQVSTNGMMMPMSEEEFSIFMNEIKKLPSEELLKHTELISRLPQIFASQQSTVGETSQLHQVLECRRPVVKNSDYCFDILKSNFPVIEDKSIYFDKHKHR